MLSISLCGVRPQNPWRITLLAKFTPHNHNAGPVSGTRAQRRFRLAGPLLRAFRLAARRRVRSPDRPLRSPRPGRALLRGPHLIVTVSSAQAAGGWLRCGGASARVRPARRAWRSLDSSPPRCPDAGIQIVACDSAHIVPGTGRVRFSRTFVGELGSPASLRHLSHCLGGTSGFDADACLARIVAFLQEPPSGPV